MGGMVCYRWGGHIHEVGLPEIAPKLDSLGGKAGSGRLGAGGSRLVDGELRPLAGVDRPLATTTVSLWVSMKKEKWS